MKFLFHPEAEIEFAAAVSFYEECQAGLGDTFSIEVFASIDRILKFPESWSRYTDHTRRCLCRTFPYSVVYSVKEDKVVIYAVMHQKRKPGYWKDRLR